MGVQMSLDESLTSFQRRAVEGLDRLLAWLERDRLPLFLIFLYVLAVGTVRDLVEYYLLDQEFVTSSHPWIFSIAHHMAFYVVVFMGLVFLLTAFSGRGVRRSINYVSMFYWIIVLPPVIDHFLFGLSQNYAYFSITDFINALFGFSGEKFHPGQALEVGVVIFALIAYGVWTNRRMLFSVRDRAITFARIGLLVIFTFIALFIAATPASFLPVIPEQFPNFDSVRYYQYHLFFFVYYLVAAVVLALAITYLSIKASFTNVLRSMRPAQTIFFAAIVAAGVVTGWRSAGSLNLVTRIAETPYWVNLAFVGVSLMAAVMAWQASTIWNDISDRDSDSKERRDRTLASGTFSPGALWQISAILAVSSLACSALLSWQLAVVIGTIILLSLLYSFKPIRFKDHILSPALIGIGAYLALTFGSLTPFSEVVVLPSTGVDIAFLSGNIIAPALTMESFLLGFFMFLGLVVGSMVTDVDGYEEDLKAGVRTIYTMQGKDKGIRIISALVLLVSLCPLILFNSPIDLLVFVILGLVATMAFLKSRRSRPVMLLAMMGLAYAALRYLSLLTL